MLQTILNQLLQQAEDSISMQAQLCGDIRTAMNTLVTSLGLDPQFLFGDSYQYFEPGMHEQFLKRPEPLATHPTPEQRKPEMTELENKHVDLYDCDKKQYVFEHIKIVIEFLKGAGFAELRQEMLDKIEQQPANVIAQFISNPQTFFNWLKDKVKISAQYKFAELYGEGVGALETKFQYEDIGDRTPVYRNEMTNQGQRSSLLAATDGSWDDLLIYQANHPGPKEIQFEYLQGFREINGVHRAYYMEAICQARHQNLLTVANPTLMPIEVANTGSDGRSYSVYLDNIRFRVGQPALMDAFIILEMPS
jgi:hypothetical protein